MTRTVSPALKAFRETYKGRGEEMRGITPFGFFVDGWNAALRDVAATRDTLESARRVEPATDEHEPPTPAPKPRPVQWGSQGDSAHTPKGGNDA